MTDTLSLADRLEAKTTVSRRDIMGNPDTMDILRNPDGPEAAKELRRLSALETENAALTKALTGLTCNGSEFFIRKGDRYVADIEACVAYVRRGKEDAHRRTVEAITRAQSAEHQVQVLRKALEEINGYAVHDNDCYAYKGKPCDCGYSDANRLALQAYESTGPKCTGGEDG